MMKKDPLLDHGEELPPHYPSDEETFFGPKSLVEKSVLKDGKLPTIPPPTIREASTSESNSDGPKSKKHTGEDTPISNPPSYHSDEKKLVTSEPEESQASFDSAQYERAVTEAKQTAPIMGSSQDVLIEGSSSTLLKSQQAQKPKQQKPLQKKANTTQQVTEGSSSANKSVPITNSNSIDSINSNTSSLADEPAQLVIPESAYQRESRTSPSPEPLSRTTSRAGTMGGRSGGGASRKKKSGKKSVGKRRGKKSKTTF
ncbi:unnamed protein product [Ambrosiozyma monospora]|uniref:Unnamed protein product n=1 Tax=Ambrosiozyma monospora TaxID=43982 RepID=A0A9W6T355_AMBMO|nr:unnamed protein product [Ambrosiozyma monospora]